MPVQTKIPLQGELDSSVADYDLPDILLTVCETKSTGLLTFSSPEAEKTLFVRDGSYIFAKSSSLDDRLGEYLLRSERVALKDLATLGKLVKPGKRLGALLVESGALDPKGLVQSVVGQVRSIILSLFRWTKAEYGFVEQELPSKETITLNMPTPQLIVDGIRGIDSWWRISRGIGELDSVYRAVADQEGSIRSTDLETSELELLAMLSRPRRVEDVCADSPLREMDVCKLLWAFRSLGWVEFVEDDGSSLLESWQMNEETPAPPESIVPSEPALVEPIVEAKAEGGADSPPSFENDSALPSFSESPEQPFPPPTEDHPAPPGAPSTSPNEEKPKGEDKEDPKPETPIVGTDMDMDMEGLGEVLKGGESE
jgi:hypothetical protein